MDENEPKLSKTDCAMLLAFAVAIDSIGALLTMLLVGLVVNRIVSILAFLTLFLWLKIKGVSPVSVLIAFFFEFIPLVDALPFWTAAITRVIIKYGPSKTLSQVAEVASMVKKPTGKTAATVAGNRAAEGAAASTAATAGQNAQTAGGVRTLPLNTEADKLKIMREGGDTSEAAGLQKRSAESYSKLGGVEGALRVQVADFEKRNQDFIDKTYQ